LSVLNLETQNLISLKRYCLNRRVSFDEDRCRLFQLLW